MKPKAKLPTIELLNFEGPVLSCTKINNRSFGTLFVIQDEWNHVIEVLTRLEFGNFLIGAFEVVDSKGRHWNFSNEHQEAKPEPSKLKEFIG